MRETGCTRSSCDIDFETRGEHGAKKRRPERATDETKQGRAGRCDTEIPIFHGILYRNDEYLHHHSDPDSDDENRQSERRRRRRHRNSSAQEQPDRGDLGRGVSADVQTVNAVIIGAYTGNLKASGSVEIAATAVPITGKIL